MKPSIPTGVPLVVAGIALAGLIPVLPTADARLSKAEVKRCLTGRFPVRVTEIIQVTNAGGVPVENIRVSLRGPLRIGFGGDNFKNLRFTPGRALVRGQSKVIVRGGVQGLETLNNSPGSFRIVVTKRGNRAKITSGRYSRKGTQGVNTHLVTNGRISGSKRLPVKCRH